MDILHEYKSKILNSLITIASVSILIIIIKRLYKYKKSRNIQVKRQNDLNERKLRLYQKLQSMRLPFENIEKFCYKMSSKDISDNIKNGTTKSVDILEAFQANGLLKNSHAKDYAFIADVIYDADVDALMIDTNDDNSNKLLLGWPICVHENLMKNSVLINLIKQQGGIVTITTDSNPKLKNQPINELLKYCAPVTALRNNAVVCALTIDTIEDLIYSSDCVRLLSKVKGLCSFRPTTTRYPIAIQGCLNIIGRNVSELMCVTKSIFNNYHDIDQQQLRIGYWKKRSNEKIEILLDEIKKSQGHVILIEMEDQDEKENQMELKNAINTMKKAYKSIGGPTFVTVVNSMATIVKHFTSQLESMRKKSKADILLYDSSANDSFLELVTMASGCIGCHGLPMGTVSLPEHSNGLSLICVATSERNDEICLKVMKMIEDIKLN